MKYFLCASFLVSSFLTAEEDYKEEKIMSYIRPGNLSASTCKERNNQQDCELCGFFYYPKCKPGYRAEFCGACEKY